MRSSKASIFVIVLSLIMSSFAQAKTVVTHQPFGKTRAGDAVEVYTLKDGPLEVRIMTYGATILSIKTPDKHGKVADITLGFDDIAGYQGNDPYFGALVGRYGNRIAKGEFKLAGKTYTLARNNGPNSLHGGNQGFDKRMWSAKQVPGGVEMSYLSKDGEEGYPGNLSVTVRYTVQKDSLKIEYTATTDKPTVLNLTNHSYFNLAGQGEGAILDHLMKINASRFTPVDSTLIPTGELKKVEGTPFDFRTPQGIGKRIDGQDEQLKFGKGYDHNWVLDSSGKLAEAAEAYDPKSGRVLHVLTDQPGVQFYTGNFLDGSIKGKGGKAYPLRGAFCLETQHFPDSPNHPKFPTTELKPGQTYHTVTVYRFTTR